MLLESATDMKDEYLSPVEEYLRRIKRAIEENSHVESVRELRQVTEAGGQVVEDPKLAELLDQPSEENRVDAYLREQSETRARIKEEIRQRAAQKLAGAAGENVTESEN